ncbi:MAG: hypothetical protein Q7S03_03470 [bacterium]|nr:hypothetical protein [bacterium]
MSLCERFNIRLEYDNLWQSGQEALKMKGVAFDSELLPANLDKRKGLGLFFWQDRLVANTQPVLKALHEQFPDQIILYSFPGSPARQHITLLEMVGPTQEYEDKYQDLEAKFQEVCRPIIDQVPAVKANFTGIAATPSVILLKGEPVDNTFNLFRERLREAIEKAGLPPLLRRKVTIFHTTLGRFVKPVEDIDKLISLIRSFNSYRVGEDTFFDLQMIRASWLMAESQVTTLANFRLK